MKINILDCTLRDGGYVNKFQFENNHIKHIIEQLNFANIDIVECGFLDKNVKEKFNTSRFQNIELLNNLLDQSNLKDSLNVAMIEYGNYDVNTLSNIDLKKIKQIKGIRYSFRKSDHLKIFDDIKIIIEKGYKLFIQPISTELYTDLEIIDFINKCNQYDITAFYIVDTHGSMLRDNLRRLYYLIDNNLKCNVKLGFHSHNNLQLSYSNAIDFIDISTRSQRDIVIDCSIYGMGRGAGNLNTELLSEYLNKNFQKNYIIDYLLEVVDDYLEAIKKESTWGYSLEHYLSATQNCHPNYASFLINTKNLSIVEIKNLLSFIPQNEKREFNKKIIEEIYIGFKKKAVLPLNSLDLSFFEKNYLLLASGTSVSQNINHIKKLILEQDLQVISLNHNNNLINYNYVLFSNQVRYNEFAEEINKEQLIVTSNIKIKSKHEGSYVLNFKELYEFENLDVDNITILAINLFIKNRAKNISIAGFDGYNFTKNNYSYNEFNRVLNNDSLLQINNNLKRAVEHISTLIHITFLTPSIFKKYTKQKVIGIIPSRYASTRLPGKPLKEIAGLPMIIHVLKRAQLSKVLDEVYVATDDDRIYQEVLKYGGKVIMTDIKHNNGSERMYEVSQKITGDIYVVINGDEALLKPEHIDEGVNGLMKSDAPVSLLYNDFNKKNSPSDFKVVLNNKEEIMYISRSDIPSDYRMNVDNMYKAYHVMSFKQDFLDTYISLEQTPLDKIESHELLRVLENGYKIQGIKVDSTAISVDTPDDLEFVRNEMKSNLIFSTYKDCIND